MIRRTGGWLLLLAAAAAAESVDTTIVADGSAGPYLLGARYVDSASVSVRFADSSASIVPPYTYVGQVNGLLFSDPLDSGRVLAVSYRTRYAGLPKVISLYPKTFVDTSDTGRAGRSAMPPPIAPFGGADELAVSGYKSIGVSVGSLGQMNVMQSLDVTASGQVGPSTELSAHVTDAGTTLEGSTREVGELDLVYVTLTNPRYKLTVGDQYVAWPRGGLLTDSKKIKGLSAALTARPVSISGFGALSGGRVAVQSVVGQSGLQGPYMLKGNGEGEIITPVRGTVKVNADGTALVEGEDADFTVDYERGSITFMPRFPVTDRMVLRLEYEYKTYDYQRYMAGTSVEVTAGDTLLTVGGALWNETDNRNQPIDMALSAEEIRRLREDGDNALVRLSGRPVDPRRVPIQDAYEPLYRIDTSGGTTHYVYAPYLPGRPAETSGFYSVAFTAVAAGQGDYRDTVITDTLQRRRRIHVYAGPGAGDATAFAPVSMPQSSTVGEVRARLRPSSWLMAEASVAGQNRDRNLFSARDDDDNNGAATGVSVILGRKDAGTPSLWLTGGHRLVTAGFGREVITANERYNRWDRRSVDTIAGRTQAWESGVGGSLGPRFTAEAIYGQLRRDADLLTDRVSFTSGARPLQALRLRYRGEYFHHHGAALTGRTHTQQAGGELLLGPATVGLDGVEQWRVAGGDTGRGHVGGGASLVFAPLSLEERLSATGERRGSSGLFGSVDTGYTLEWRQSASASPVVGWRFCGQSSARRQVVRDGPSQTTVLVTASNDLALPGVPLVTRQQYSVSSERAATIIQVPLYARQGLGDFSYDSATGQYVPARGGDYYMRQEEVYDNTNSQRVRTTDLDASWSFSPRQLRWRGLLGDVRWYGAYTAREHVADEPGVTGWSWLPGWMALAGPAADSALRLANVRYRQLLAWEPESLPGYRAELRLEPSVRTLSGCRERSLEVELSARRERGRWVFEGKAQAGRVAREAAAGALTGFTVRDRHVQFTEKYLLPADLRVYLEETGGWAGKEASALQRAEGWYWMLRPGVAWQPAEKGWAEASYTFSHVGLPAEGLDYRIAQGYRQGVRHTIDVFADVRIGAHFNLSGAYRGEFSVEERPQHTMTLEVKAMM